MYTLLKRVYETRMANKTHGDSGVFSDPAFVASLGDASSFLALLDAMPEVSVYAKDLDGKFVLANAAELRLLGLSRPDEFLGRRDSDFFEQSVAEAYTAEDRAVLQGRGVLNKRWQVPGRDGRMRWYLSSKLPLRDKTGKIVGLCGMLRDLERASEEAAPFGDLAKVIAHMDANAMNPIRMGELAAMANLSVSQFTRRFKELAGMTPGDYILKLRVTAAQRELAQGSRPITEIAQMLGFHDHSHFNRMFRKVTGQSPTEFRRQATLGA